MTSIPEPVTAETDDLREFVRECVVGILDAVPDLLRPEAEMEAAVLCAAYARRCSSLECPTSPARWTLPLGLDTVAMLKGRV